MKNKLSLLALIFSFSFIGIQDAQAGKLLSARTKFTIKQNLLTFARTGINTTAGGLSSYMSIRHGLAAYKLFKSNIQNKDFDINSVETKKFTYHATGSTIFGVLSAAFFYRAFKTYTEQEEYQHHFVDRDQIDRERYERV